MQCVRVVRKFLIKKAWDFEPKTVGEHIKRERLKRRLLQKDLSPLFNVDTFTILNWETGATKPQIKDVPALISFLGYDPEPPSPVTVAEQIWAKRRERGWSQRQAASYMGVDPCTWSSWEQGGTIKRPEHRKLVADFLGLNANLVHRLMKQRWNDGHGKPT